MKSSHNTTPTTWPRVTWIATVVILLLAAPAWAQTGTVMPPPFQTALDNSGAIINAACVWVYSAGTTTAATTYTDKALAVPNTNPIRSDSAGRFTAYLVPGTTYKFVYEGSCTPPAHGTVLRTADNIDAVPTSSATVDVTGTAGESIAAGLAVYLSDGSGGKSAGQWYKADSANTYSSTTNWVGVAPSAIASGASGTIRLAGSVTGLSSLAAGSIYYVGTAGALTSTAPTNARKLGEADTTTSLVVTANPPAVSVTAPIAIANGRVTLTSGTPVTTTDVTAATTLYYALATGNRIALYDGTTWNTRIFTELSIAVPATTSTMYDIFIYDNSGTPTLELLAWTNDTTRATALVRQDGVWSKTGVLTRRYVGSFRTTTVSGQTEDSVAKRYVWNYDNRVLRPMRATETSNWGYSTASYRQANGNTADQLDFVIGVNEVVAHAVVLNAVTTSAATQRAVQLAIGLDSTTVAATGCLVQSITLITSIGAQAITTALDTYPGVGRHTLVWLELGGGGDTQTWGGAGASPVSGISGFIQG